jgi:hypothetical protein
LSKKTNWFRHDYNARNDIKLQRINAEFGLVGIGLYWIIVEIMHENKENNFCLSELEDLAFLYKIDFEDAILILERMMKVNLFYENEGCIYSKNVDLQNEYQTIRNEQLSEIRKVAGSKGGRPKSKIKQNKANDSKDKQTIANDSKTKQKKLPNLTEHNITIHNNTLEEKKEIDKSISKEKAEFDFFRKEYRDVLGGLVLGLDNEFKNFQRIPNWIEILPILANAVHNERKYRDKLKSQDKFVPEPKHLKTWINNRCWEIEYPNLKTEEQIKAERMEEQTRKQLAREAMI